MESKEAYLVRSKEQAFKHLDKGDVDTAYDCIINALKNHDELLNHAAIDIGRILKEDSILITGKDIRTFIEGIK